MARDMLQPHDFHASKVDAQRKPEQSDYDATDH
jgi:hypothetical protein